MRIGNDIKKDRSARIADVGKIAMLSIFYKMVMRKFYSLTFTNAIYFSPLFYMINSNKSSV